MKTWLPALHGVRRIQVILLGVTLNCLAAGAAETGMLKSQQEKGDKKERAIMSMRITSSSFPHDGVIPARHTCDGHDTSPKLI